MSGLKQFAPLLLGQLCYLTSAASLLTSVLGYSHQMIIPSGSVTCLLDEKLIFQRVKNLRQKRLILSSAHAFPAKLLLFFIQPSFERLRQEDPSPVPRETVLAPKPKLSVVFGARIPMSSSQI